MLGFIADLHLPSVNSLAFEKDRAWIKTQAAINALRANSAHDIVILGDASCGMNCVKGISYTKPLLELLEKRFSDVNFYYIRGNHDDLSDYEFRRPVDFSKYDFPIAALPYAGGPILLNDKKGTSLIMSHLPLYPHPEDCVMNREPNNYWNRESKAVNLLKKGFEKTGGFVVSGHYHFPKGDARRISPYTTEDGAERRVCQAWVPSASFAVSKGGNINIDDNAYGCMIMSAPDNCAMINEYI